jgi:hypothetical protein
LVGLKIKDRGFRAPVETLPAYSSGSDSSTCSTPHCTDDESGFDSSTNGDVDGIKARKKQNRVVHVTPVLVNTTDDKVYLRVGRGCVLGTNVLPSLLCYEDAPEWKDEVDNGAPIVGCVSSMTAFAVVTTLTAIIS